MALTLNNFWGAETGTEDECTSVAGSAGASTTQIHSGDYSYVTASTSNSISFSPFEAVADAGSGYIFGAWIFMVDANTPANNIDWLRFREATSNFLTLTSKNGSGDVEIRDANNSIIRTVTAPFTDNTWHYIEIYFQHSASGTVELFIDGVSQGSDSGQDLTDGGTFDNIGIYGNSTSGTDYVYWDDMHFLSGATAASDRLGGSEIFTYDSTKNSAIPDVGDTLTSGQWDELFINLWTDTVRASYGDTQAGAVNTDDAGGSAGTGGPNTDANVSGSIIGAKGIWRMARSGGGGTAHYGLLGNHVDLAQRSVDFDPITTHAPYYMVSEAASVVPLDSEYFQIGFEIAGKQDWLGSGMAPMLLHVPVLGRTVTCDPESIAVTETDASVITSVPRVVGCTTESIAVTENDATVDKNVPLVVTCNTETIAVVEAAATAFTDLKLHFYFDASDDAATGTNWTSAASSFGEFFSTGGYISEPYQNELWAGGTSASLFTDPGGTINDVRFRVRVTVPAAYSDGDFEVFTDGKAQSLGSWNSGSSFNDFGPWTDLSTPTGGWTWAKLQALEAYVNPVYDTGTGQFRVWGIELEVSYSIFETTTTTLYYNGTALGTNWTNVSNVTDGDDATYGNIIAPNTDILQATGTNVTAGQVADGLMITRVEGRFKGTNLNYVNSEVQWEDRFDIGFPMLTQSAVGLSSSYTSWEELGEAISGSGHYEGGFNWTKLSNLEMRAYPGGTEASGDLRVYIVELRVTHITTTNLNVTTTTESIAVTETDAAVNRSRIVGCSTESIAVTENDATISTATHRTVTCTSESIHVSTVGGFSVGYLDESSSSVTGTWTNLSQAFDGDEALEAYYFGSTGGDASLQASGSNLSSGQTIKQVRARQLGYHTIVSGSAIPYTRIYKGGEFLTQLGFPTTLKDWSSWQTLSVPAAGWDWSAVSGLTAVFFDGVSTGSHDFHLYVVEIEVTHGPGITEVNRGRNVGCSTESIAVTENDATVTAATPLVVTCNTESIAVTENAAAVNRSRIVLQTGAEYNGTNLLPNSHTLAGWTTEGTPVLTTGQPGIIPGLDNATKVEDNSAAFEYRHEWVYVGINTKKYTLRYFIKKQDSGDSNNPAYHNVGLGFNDVGTAPYWNQGSLSAWQFNSITGATLKRYGRAGDTILVRTYAGNSDWWEILIDGTNPGGTYDWVGVLCAPAYSLQWDTGSDASAQGWFVWGNAELYEDTSKEDVSGGPVYTPTPVEQGLAIKVTENAATVTATTNRDITCTTESIAVTENPATVNSTREITGLSESIRVSYGLETTVGIFDANVAGPTDPNVVWTDDANAFDGDQGSYAYTSTTGTSNYLSGTGVNVETPIISTRFIEGVRVRALAAATGGGSDGVYADIYYSAELLTPGGIFQGSDTPAWTNWGSGHLDDPSGGWDWTAIAGLEVRHSGTGTLTEGRVYTTEVEVTYARGSTVSIGKTTACGTESIAVTENDATIKIDRTVGCSTESIAVTESQATVNNTRNVTGDTESIAVTENQVAINSSRPVTGTTEFIAVTENPATIKTDRGTTGLTESIRIGYGLEYVVGYFDVSVAGPTDAGVAWTDDANAFNGLEADYAYTSTEGNESSNALVGSGISLENPLTLGRLIDSVNVRIYGSAQGSGTPQLLTFVYVDGENQTPGGISNVQTTPYWTAWGSGGIGGPLYWHDVDRWTWLQNMEVRFAGYDGSGVLTEAQAYVAQVQVEYERGSTVNKGRVVGCATESIAVAENQALVNGTLDVSAGTEVIAVTENIAQIFRGDNLDVGCTTELIVVTENAATVTTTTPRVVTCTTESILVLENQATVTKDVTASTRRVFIVT